MQYLYGCIEKIRTSAKSKGNLHSLQTIVRISLALQGNNNPCHVHIISHPDVCMGSPEGETHTHTYIMQALATQSGNYYRYTCSINVRGIDYIQCIRIALY